MQFQILCVHGDVHMKYSKTAVTSLITLKLPLTLRGQKTVEQLML